MEHQLEQHIHLKGNGEARLRRQHTLHIYHDSCPRYAHLNP